MARSLLRAGTIAILAAGLVALAILAQDIADQYTSPCQICPAKWSW